MAKQKKEKFYAIKVGNGVNNIILRSWEECKPLVLGCKAVYKSFKTEDEAKGYINSVSVEKKQESIRIAIERKKEIKNTTVSIQARIPTVV